MFGLSYKKMPVLFFYVFSITDNWFCQGAIGSQSEVIHSYLHLIFKKKSLDFFLFNCITSIKFGFFSNII